jgi:hypothetical protein
MGSQIRSVWRSTADTDTDTDSNTFANTDANAVRMRRGRRRIYSTKLRRQRLQR